MIQTALIRIIFLLFLPLMVGYFIKGKISKSNELSSKLIRALTAYLIPLISFIAFWQIKIEIKLITLPLIGIFLTTAAGLVGFVFSKIHQLTKKQCGTYLAGAAFSNIGWGGGTLLGYIFLGQAGVALALAYGLYFNFYYYTLGFGLASHYGDETSTKPNLRKIFSNKLVYLPLSGVILGILFSLFKIGFPFVLQRINDYLILPFSIISSFAIGLTLYLRNVWQCTYNKNVYFSLSLIKFIFTPLLGLLFAYLFGLSTLMAKVVFIMSLMPAAESSMHISRIFNLDQNLANSNYLVTTFLATFWSIGLIFLACSFF